MARRGYRPGEYTNVSVETEITINFKAWWLGCLIADACLIAILIIEGLVFSQLASPREWLFWLGNNWTWHVMAMVAVWPVVGTFTVGAYIAEIWFKDPHKDNPRGAFWGFLVLAAKLINLISSSDKNNAYDHLFGGGGEQ